MTSQGDTIKAAKLIRGTTTSNIQNGIQLFNEILNNAYPVDYDEVYYNIGLGYYRLGDIDELKTLRTNNPNNTRIVRLFYYLNNDEKPQGATGPIMKKHDRNQTFIVRNCGLLLAGGTLLAAACLLN